MLEHVIIAERILGKALPKGVQVHHVDSNGLNNAHSNLVICPDQSYHSLLHARTEAITACGNPNWRKCCHCKSWDDPANLAFWKRKSQKGTVIAHKKCANENFAAYKASNPEWVQKMNARRRQKYAERQGT